MYNRIIGAALALYGLILWPIVRADRFYIDDLGRSLTGYLGWSKDGRPLANVVMEQLSLGAPLTDLTPLTQIFSVLLFAGLAVALAKRFQIKGIWTAPLALLPLFASPFFLENLSYKFDIVPMTLALALSFYAFLRAPSTKGGFTAGAVALLASLCLYQPALNVFLVFVALEAILNQMDSAKLQDLIERLAQRVVQLVFALGIYKLIADSTVRGGYATQHAALSDVASLWPTLSDNLHLFFNYVLRSLWSPTGFLLLFVIAAGSIVAVVIGVRYCVVMWGESRIAAKLALIVLALVLPIALVGAMWGPMLFLASPVLAPRTQLGVGALGAACTLLIVLALRKSPWSPKVSLVFLCLSAYPLVLFASVYGDSLLLQKDYENQIADDIVDDLYRFSQTNGLKRFALKGNAGMPPVLQHNAAKYPILLRLVPIHLTEGWGWAGEQLKHAGVTLPYAMPAEVQLTDATICQASKLSVHRYYTLYAVGDVGLVWFNDAALPACDGQAR